MRNMAISDRMELRPGQFFTWQAELEGTPLDYTVAQVAFVAEDLRGDMPHALYVVNGLTPVLASCTLGNFRAACTAYRGNPWATGEELQAAAAAARAAIEASPIPGIYTFAT